MNPVDTAGAARWHRVTWFIVVLAATLLRSIALDRWPGINGDEAWYGVNVQELLAGRDVFLQTGIGNPLSPVHSGVLLALSLILEPSGTLLRLPEVILGVAAVALAYPLLARPLGVRVAWLVTLLLAISPVAVAYARLGWDPSGTPLVSLLALALALRDRPLLSALACVAGYLIHPTNVFIVPIAAAAWAPFGIATFQRASGATRARLRTFAVAGLIMAIPLAGWMAWRVAQNPDTTLPSVRMVIDRVTSPARWAARGWGFVNLVSGVSTTSHIAAPLADPVAAAANTTFAFVLALSLLAGWPMLRAHQHARWLLAGMLAAFAGFHVIAMELALQPSLERYGMFMFVPMLITLAMAVDACTTRARAVGRLAAFATLTLFGAMTVGAYFYPIATRGGDAIATFRTGAVEPKLAAYGFIAAHSAGAATRVIAEDWFLYWTLRYFAGTSGPIHVEPVPGGSLPGGTRPQGAAEPPLPPPARAYVVTYGESPYPAQLDLGRPLFTAFDPIGRPVVQVFAAPQLLR